MCVCVMGGLRKCLYRLKSVLGHREMSSKGVWKSFGGSLRVIGEISGIRGPGDRLRLGVWGVPRRKLEGICGEGLNTRIA